MNRNKFTRILLVCALALMAAALLAACAKKPADTSAPGTAAKGGGITITKSDVTDQATFIPYQAGRVKMEIIAVRAPDDTIRTALNTCQVCYDSGRGYYVQEGDRLVCQNCGNQFKISQVEKQKNGCNPVPILDDQKTDDGKTITISADLLEKAAPLFANWKTR